MKDLIPNWPKRLFALKEAMKARGEIAGDIDLATTISELLDAVHQPVVERGAVNHWLKGRRQPNVAQFIALCRALKVSPADILADDRYHLPACTDLPVRQNAEAARIYEHASAEITDIITLLNRATPEARRLAIAAAKGVLASYPAETISPNSKQG